MCDGEEYGPIICGRKTTLSVKRDVKSKAEENHPMILGTRGSDFESRCI